MRYLAVDFGTKRIGLATGEDNGFGGFPLATIVRSRSLSHDIGEILRLAAREQVEAIIVGLPLHQSGEPGPMSRLAEEFSRALKKRTPLPVHLVDEFLTSAEAEEELIARDVSRQRRKAVVDQLAAAYILERFLARSAAPCPPEAAA